MDDERPGWTGWQRTARKTVILAVGLLGLTLLPYLVVGLWNRAFGGWRSVFFCYAGNRGFVATYAPPGVEGLFRWRPSPIGILRHNGKLGLVLAAPVSEEQMLSPSNAASFRRLRRRIRRIAWMMGVRDVNLAGVLPGRLAGDDILSLPDNRPAVRAAVLAAVAQMTAQCFDGQRPAVILLGGAGHIGKDIFQALTDAGWAVHVVDPRTGADALPPELRGCQCLLIDVARRGVIARYVDQMWPGLVVLNETFPQPASHHVRAMQRAGVAVYHLSGFRGSVVPPLPYGYANAVPCCAAHGIAEPVQIELVQLAALSGAPAARTAA